MDVIQINNSQLKQNKLIIDLPVDYRNIAFDGYLVLNKKTIIQKELFELSGKLIWEGDGVSEQRKLRDEWE